MTGARTLVTAHSGCMGSPPNGREHIRRAIEAGADIIELDIRLASDGHVVLSHDESLAGSRGERLLIAAHPWKDLASAARTEGKEILDLELAFDLLAEGGLSINLDAKEAEAALEAASVARRRGIGDRVLFSGLGKAEALYVRTQVPDFRCLLNADLLLPIYGYGEREMRLACEALTESGCCGINLDWRAATPGLMAWSRRRCIPVFLWTPDAEGDLRKAIGLEPWSITTNRVDLLVSLVKSDHLEGTKR